MMKPCATTLRKGNKILWKCVFHSCAIIPNAWLKTLSRSHAAPCKWHPKDDSMWFPYLVYNNPPLIYSMCPFVLAHTFKGKETVLFLFSYVCHIYEHLCLQIRTHSMCSWILDGCDFNLDGVSSSLFSFPNRCTHV